MKKLLAFSTVFVSSFCWAAGGGDHAGVPVVVLYQAINVGALVLILVYFLRKKVSAALVARKDSHEGRVQEARRVVQDAEQRNHEIKNKIKSVETTKQKTLEEAQLNAEQLKKKIIEEARLQAEQLKKEAARAAEYEFEKARNDLRAELLEEVMKVAQQNISNKINSGKQASLNKEFIDGVRLN